MMQKLSLLTTRHCTQSQTDSVIRMEVLGAVAFFMKVMRIGIVVGIKVFLSIVTESINF